MGAFEEEEIFDDNVEELCLKYLIFLNVKKTREIAMKKISGFIEI